MTTEKQDVARQQFEKWAEEVHGGKIDKFLIRDPSFPDDYQAHDLEWAWRAWQFSAERVRIELQAYRDMPDKQDAAAPSLTESCRQLREITTDETKQRIDEWREQREKYNDEVEFLRAELQAYREALCSMAAAIQSLDLESDYYVDGRRHPTVKSKLTSVLSDVEALLAKGDKK